MQSVTIGAQTGLYQEFSPAPNTPTFTAPISGLVMPNVNAPASNTAVLQVTSDIFGYVITLGGVKGVGFPTSSTQSCPSGGPSACTYQIFTSTSSGTTTTSALFAYTNPLPSGQACVGGGDTNCANIKGAEYTKWQTLGGITSDVGLPVSVSSAITASTGNTANQQLFSGGAFYGITSGTDSGDEFAVANPIYTTYTADQGPAGTLGLPTSDQQGLPGGIFQQTFEGGTIQYTAGNAPVILLPVKSVVIVGPNNFTNGTTLSLNASAQLTAQVYAASGAAINGRPITWNFTNPSVLSLTPNGISATVKGIGGGISNVTATVGGVNSAVYPVTVNAPCCTIGDGAPSSVQAAFQSALSRQQLNVTVPVPTAAQRAGNGYIQTVTLSGSTQSVLLAEADSSPLAFVVGGSILTAYLASGGPSGPAGYPTADATSGGRQMFANAAIAGNPAYVVTGQILTKWSALGYETGSLGLPSVAASTFTSALGESGTQQLFQNGAIFGITSGPHIGSTYAVTGLILSLYNSLGGPAGTYGAPLGDQSPFRQYLQLRLSKMARSLIVSALTAAVAHPNPANVTRHLRFFLHPQCPGSRLLLTVSGFSNGDTVTVSVTNQPSFTVTLPLGVFYLELRGAADCYGGHHQPSGRRVRPA